MQILTSPILIDVACGIATCISTTISGVGGGVEWSGLYAEDPSLPVKNPS